MSENENDIDQRYPRSEGWLTGPELCVRLGIKRVQSKSVARYERVGSVRSYLYRILNTAEAKDASAKARASCEGCNASVTPRRAFILNGVSLCASCSRAATVGNDKDLIKRLRL
jgi:hypothetical protein